MKMFYSIVFFLFVFQNQRIAPSIMCQIYHSNNKKKPNFYLVFIELGDGWGAVEMESEVEYFFIEENLRTDQNQEYWVNGSFYEESFSIGRPLSFQVYTPRQSGNTCILLIQMKFINI